MVGRISDFRNPTAECGMFSHSRLYDQAAYKIASAVAPALKSLILSRNAKSQHLLDKSLNANPSVGPMTSPAEAMDQAEEEDLRNWASLREHQQEYAKTMGASPG